MGERLLLLRTAQPDDPYVEELSTEGFDVRSLPVLEFEYVNRKELREALASPDSYDGLILTSPRAVDALGEAMPWLPSENVLWHAKPVFAVGPRTASDLRRLGFEPEGEESGSANMLADYIAERAYDRPLLFLCGDRRRDVLPDRLEKAGIHLDEIVVYRSRPRTYLELDAVAAPSWIVFFSPSGFEAVDETDLLSLDSVGIAAIGPTTASALRDRGIRVDAVAEDPSPRALALAIRRARGG